MQALPAAWRMIRTSVISPSGLDRKLGQIPPPTAATRRAGTGPDGRATLRGARISRCERSDRPLHTAGWPFVRRRARPMGVGSPWPRTGNARRLRSWWP